MNSELIWEGEIPLEQLLEHVSPAYGDSWQAVADTLHSDAIENAIIDTLINESQKSGLFETPVQIEILEPCEGGDKCDDLEGHGEWCVPWGEPARVVLCNGTHRVVAAMTASYGGIKVTQRHESADVDHAIVVKFKATAVGDQYICPDCDDFAECFGFCVLRSFRLNDEHWVEAGMASRVNGVFNLYYEVAEDQKDALGAKIQELAKTHNVELDEFNVNIEREEDWV